MSWIPFITHTSVCTDEIYIYTRKVELRILIPKQSSLFPFSLGFLSILTWYQEQVTRLSVLHDFFFSFSGELSCGFSILGTVLVNFWRPCFSVQQPGFHQLPFCFWVLFLFQWFLDFCIFFLWFSWAISAHIFSGLGITF
jgi:hypothetical protein